METNERYSMNRANRVVSTAVNNVRRRVNSSGSRAGMVATALAAMVLFVGTITLASCASTTATYDRATENDIKHQKHDRGGRGRGA